MKVDDILGLKEVNIGTLKSAFLNKRENILYEGVLTEHEISKFVSEIGKYSKEEIINKIVKMFDEVESGNVSEEQLEKVEAYLVLLLKNIPVEKSEADIYWKEKVDSIDKKDNNRVVIEVAAIHPLVEGKPNQEFQERLRKAIEIYNIEKDELNDPIIYVPGSIHSVKKEEFIEDACALSEAGKEFLIDNGIPEEDIRAEDANIKYKYNDGVYNSGDECYVASQIANNEDRGRIISLVSPVQVYRKALFYHEFGYNPEMYAVPTEKTAHNYISEAFWSLYLTYMRDNDWQKSFLSCLTRKERDRLYQEKVGDTKEYIDEILAQGPKIPQEVLDQRDIWQKKYNIAAQNMNNAIENKKDILVEIARTEDKEEDEVQRIKEIIENNSDVDITIVTNSSDNIQDIMKIVEENEEHVRVKNMDSIEGIAKEFHNGNYKKFYGMYPSVKSISQAIEYIKRGVIPIISSLPGKDDNYVPNVSKLLEDITRQNQAEKNVDGR
ncbi:MAG: hypothetical protein HFJ17_01225 [Clostridia bacterium]|nr:hypothetical protein [Clostridia bacterium]